MQEYYPSQYEKCLIDCLDEMIWQIVLENSFMIKKRNVMQKNQLQTSLANIMKMVLINFSHYKHDI